MASPVIAQSDWSVPTGIQGYIDPNALELQRNPGLVPPRYLKAEWTTGSNNLSVTVTIGNGGMTSTAPLTFYNLYFIPSTFMSSGTSTAQARAAIAAFPPFVYLSSAAIDGSVVYKDTAHVNTPGFYLATTVGANGEESLPCSPAPNPFNPDAQDVFVVPPEATTVSVTKSTVVEPGDLSTDTTYTLGVIPKKVAYLGGYQIYVKSYNNDTTMRESILLSPALSAGPTYTYGTLRLPTDAAGHTIYFYFVPVSVGGARRPDPQNSTSTSIASGP